MNEVQITATEAVPEFSTLTSILLILVVLTVAIAIYKTKTTQNTNSLNSYLPSFIGLMCG